MVNDALQKDVKKSGLGLRLREDTTRTGDFFLEGLTQRVVADDNELSGAMLDGLEQAELLDREDEEHKRGPRSHKLCTVTVLRRTSAGDVMTSVLHFLDVAGVDRTWNGQSVTVNASKPYGGRTASRRAAAMRGGGRGGRSGRGKAEKQEDPVPKALVRVTDSLHDNNSHIPYRDSKVTRLLKGALGGGGQGVLIGCVSNGASNFSECEAILQYLHKCLSVASPAVKSNVVNAAKEIAALKPRIHDLAQSLYGKAAEEADAMKPREVGIPPTACSQFCPLPPHISIVPRWLVYYQGRMRHGFASRDD